MRVHCLCLIATLSSAACNLGDSEPIDEPEPDPILVADVAWEFTSDCPPEQMIAAGSRIITSCRTAAVGGSDLHARVLEPATGEVVSDTIVVFAGDSSDPFGTLTLAMSEVGGLAVATRVGPDSDVGALLVPLDADAAAAGPLLAVDARVALPAMADGRATFLTAPLIGGAWQLEALEDGERVTIADLGIAQTPLARAHFEGGFGVLHARPTGECDVFACWSSLVWARFDDAGTALDESEIIARFALPPEEGPSQADLVSLVETDTGFALAATSEAGGTLVDTIHWFRLDREGRVASNPPVIQLGGNQINDFVFAALPDGELVVASHEESYPYSYFHVRLLEGDEQSPVVTVPRSIPIYQSAVQAVATPDGVLFLVRRRTSDERKESRTSAVLVQRP